MKKHFAIFALLLLAACGDARQTCIIKSTKELQTVRGLIAKTEANIARGYGMETKVEPVVFTTICVGSGIGNHGRVGYCSRSEPRTSRVPVTIDVDAERRKLRTLRKKEAELKAASVSAVQRCELAHPKN